ncbi:MAG: DciA family protein [Caulobacteraceae bacterium]
MPRPLPSAGETARILAAKRTRPAGRPPPTAGRTLAKTLKALDARFGQGASGLQARWTEIVGGALARRTEPAKLTAPKAGGGACLELRVEGPSATLIQHQAPDILARVNLFLGAGAVARLRIVQGPLRGTARQDPLALHAARRRIKGPLDAAAEQALTDSLAKVPEGRLKQALERLGREVLRDGRS